MKEIMNKLTKEEMFKATKDGIKEALLTMTESGDGWSGLIRTDQFMEAIRSGVSDGIWRIATNATQMPCADFYEMIKEGVKEGMPSKLYESE